MKCKGRKSKKQKLSLKYNIQKRVREKTRRMKKEAKKLGLRKKKRKDPGIPNTFPFKAEFLEDIERQKERKEEELAQRRTEAKKQAKVDRETREKETHEASRERELERRRKRAEQVLLQQLDTLRKLLLKAEVFVQVLDARDPLGCRCPELEAYLQENGKRLIFCLAKCDLVTPQHAAQWLLALGKVAPTIAVQVEGGSEGLVDLLRLVGHAPDSSTVEAAKSVAIVGYPGTGKRALVKALRKEVKGSSAWLLEAIGRLRQAEDFEGEAAAANALHLAIRGILPKDAVATAHDKSGVDPLLVVKNLLERAGAQAVMRRYRIPAFEGVEGFLSTWSGDRQVKTKRGKDPTVQTAAVKYIFELAASPGCSCAPPSTDLDGVGTLWTSHANSRAALEAVMKAQLDLLQSRDSLNCSAAKSLVLESRGTGPSIALKELMEGEKAEDDEASAEDDDMEGEGEEEEDLEGDEEEDLDDDDMEED
jgi:nuclear GTP-binding protein